MIIGASSPRDAQQFSRTGREAPSAVGRDHVLLAEDRADVVLPVDEMRVDGDHHPRRERTRVAVPEDWKIVVHAHTVSRPDALMIAVTVGLALCGTERRLDRLTGLQHRLDVPERAQRAVGDGERGRRRFWERERAALLDPRPVGSDDLHEARDEVVGLVAPSRRAAWVLLIALTEDVGLQRAALAHGALDRPAHLPFGLADGELLDEARETGIGNLVG